MLSAANHDARLRNLSGIVRKVYDAVPMSEPWSMSYINSEVQRNGGTTRDARVVYGCINSLKAAGLVNEPVPGVFIRVAVRPAKPKTIDQSHKKEDITMSSAATAVAKTVAKTAQRAPLSILSDLAARLRQVADDVETAALEIDEHMAQNSAGAEKLAQLQRLLAG